MKKFLAILLTALLVVSTLAIMPLSTSASAGEAPTTFKFGDADVDIRLIEDFTDYDDQYVGFLESTFNRMDGVNGTSLQILSGGWVGSDYYDLPVDAGLDMTGARYLVFPILNYSDGDVYLNFQGRLEPAVEGVGPTYFLRPDQEIWLVDMDGFAETTTNTADTTLCSNRYGYMIPELFEGYMIIPTSALCLDRNYDVSASTGDIELVTLGFHVASDIATYLELYIDDVFVATELPEYVEPGSGEPEVTEPAETDPVDTDPVDTDPVDTDPVDTDPVDTDPVETEPETAPETNPETKAETKAPDTDKKDDDEKDDDDKKDEKSGCASVVAVAAALPVILGGAVLVLNRRREND